MLTILILWWALKDKRKKRIKDSAKNITVNNSYIVIAVIKYSGRFISHPTGGCFPFGVVFIIQPKMGFVKFIVVFAVTIEIKPFVSFCHYLYKPHYLQLKIP